jgi:hypothetical protein
MGKEHKLHSVEWTQRDTPFVFSLLRINSVYTFRALLAHLQVALHKQQLVYCYQDWSGTPLQPW